MRLFAVMSDGSIVVPTNVDIECYPHKRIEFTVNDKIYIYRDVYSDDYEMFDGNIRIHIPKTSFKVYHNYEWFFTDDVCCILITNPEEDEELNYFETTDFNAGIIYSKVERILAPALKNTKSKIAGNITLPRIQLLPKVMFNGVTQDGVLKNICNRVITHFNAIYGKQFELTFPNVTEEGKYYIEFHFEINRKEEYKEMTVAEIEKELGYKIKVVGEK